MPNLLEKKSVKKVKEFFKNINENIELILLDETAKTAKDAAKSLKKEVGAIIKSLLFKNEKKNDYYLCLVSGDQYISLHKLSKILNGNIIVKANAAECKEMTGFSIGGISPVAHANAPTRIFIDENLSKFTTIYGAAGNPYVVFGISFKKLCSITKGEIDSIVE